jgi:hypothetical protein
MTVRDLLGRRGVRRAAQVAGHPWGPGPSIECAAAAAGSGQLQRGHPDAGLRPAAGRPCLRLLVLHDDPDREFDYVAGAEQALQLASTNAGWWSASRTTGRPCSGHRAATALGLATVTGGRDRPPLGRAVEARRWVSGVSGTRMRPRVGRSRSKVTNSSSVTTSCDFSPPRPSAPPDRAPTASSTQTVRHRRLWLCRLS